MRFIRPMLDRWTRLRRRLWLRHLEHRRLVDAEFVAVQFGVPEADADAAIALLLESEPRLGYAPHPLVEPAWPRRVRRSNSYSPYLLPRANRRTIDGDDVLEPGTEWRHVAEAPVTEKQHRAHALAVAREFARQNAHSLRRDRDNYFPADRDYPVDDRRVSVIMPVLNRAQAIQRAIASVKAQTHSAWELIVVDDGSTDGTPSVVKELQKEDDRILLISHDGSGVSAARNAGIERASGDVVAFLDSDNVWRPTHLAACLAHLDDPEAIAVHCVVSVRHADGRTTYAAHEVEPDALTEGRNPVDLNALVVGRSPLTAIGGFDESLRRWVDYDLVLRLAKSLRFRLVDELGVEYDHRDDAADRITTRESPLWRRVVLHRALIAGEVPVTEADAHPLVVIRNRNCWPQTIATLTHLLGADSTIRIAVIDAASTRDNAAILGSMALAIPRLTVTRTAGDLGWTVSAALACREAGTGVSAVVAVQPGSTPASRDLQTVIEREPGLRYRRPRASGVLFAGSPRELIELEPAAIIDDPLVPMES